MKHIKTMIITVVLAGMLCTGCGAVGNIKDYSPAVLDADENNAKKEIVNGTDGTSNNGTDAQETEEEKCYYKNDNNSYDVSYKDVSFDDDDNGYLVQYGLDEKKVVDKVELQNIDEVAWVTNEWVYYTEIKNNYSLWRIPIKKAENGDNLNVSGKEKLISMAYIDDDIYITDTYIIFFGREKENKSSLLYKYEIQDKKYNKLLDLDYGSIIWGEGYPIMIDGMLFVSDNYKIYQLNPDTADVKKIYQGSDKIDEWYDTSVSGNCLYFTDSENDFYKYNVGDEKTECLISSDSLEKVMKKLNLWGDKSKGIYISIDEYYIYNGQVYFDVWACWEEKDSKIFGKSVWVEYDCEEVLLSASLDDITNLQCVDVVKTYIDDHTKWNTYEDDQEYFADKEIEIDFLDGKILLAMDGEEPEESFAVYNLDTGKIKEINEKEWESRLYEIY